ncbi:CotY/CotZ family spore coat protein [Cytobacillus firmus]|uniref:CotY/CotZ family spore coat protein n=1 Tax=Cytobacillus firmus TaxID=1399 RepID=UPI0021ADD761|nr:CotY/CotZ family spore coat protein [Cytobacillus firmus]
MFKYSHQDDKDESSCCHDDDKHRDCMEEESSDDCQDKEKKEKDKGKKDDKDDKDKKDHHKHPTHHKVCVREVLAAILNAQKKAKRDDECKTSCNESIKELLGESKKPKKNTIPFILYNEEAEPFKASGVTIISHTKQKKFACIESFIFKIKDLDGKCAVLELLTFKPGKCTKDPFRKSICSPCSQIDCENVSDLMGTGICINVDLSCFCAVTCLPAVRL